MPGENLDLITCRLQDDGIFPNSKLPLVVYRMALVLDGEDPAATWEECFAHHEWRNSWRNGIYDYPHYHSTAHEVLGVSRGWASVRFGGIHGTILTLVAGDAVVIPAGVVHQSLSASGDFQVVGAYPRGMDWDLCRGLDGERPAADARIAQVKLPTQDPIHGQAGPLLRLWKE